MNTMIQFDHIPSNQHSVATGAFDSIDPCLLADIAGGKGNNFLTRFGENMQKGGEYAMAAGAVGTVVPGLGETGIPEGVAAGGGASWLIGKGAQALGNLF
jgi:hypothetical protein